MHSILCMLFFVSGSTGGFQPKRPTLLNKTLLNQTQQAQQNTPNRPGSVTGSIEGRLANTSGGRRREFMASSPLHEVVFYKQMNPVFISFRLFSSEMSRF